MGLKFDNNFSQQIKKQPNRQYYPLINYLDSIQVFSSVKRCISNDSVIFTSFSQNHKYFSMNLSLFGKDDHKTVITQPKIVASLIHKIVF